MSMRRSTPATKTGRASAAALGILLCASALATAAAGADSADTLPAGASVYFREARGGASAPAQQTGNFDAIRRRTDAPAHVSFDGEAAQPAGLTAGATARVREQARMLASRHGPVAGSVPGLSASVDAPVSDVLSRLQYAFGSDPGLSSERTRQGEREVLLRNADAFVRATLPLTLGKEWLGFVYADMGAADSQLRYQGLLGIRVGQDAHLLGGWRRITYYFSPGRDFNSLDFDGPFLAVQRAW